MRWIKVPRAELDQLASTGSFVPIKRDRVVRWSPAGQKFIDGWFSFAQDVTADSTNALSTELVRGWVDYERIDARDRKHKYYRYIYVLTEDKQVYRRGPFKDMDWEHHHDDRPEWLVSEPDVNVRSASRDDA